MGVGGSSAPEPTYPSGLDILILLLSPEGPYLS